MLKKIGSTLMIVILAVLVISACNNSGSQENPQADEIMLEATVSAMVEESLQEEADKQAEIEAAVKATQEAIESQATPEMVDEDYYQLTEEELEDLINEAVEAAIEASIEVSESTSEVTDDETVSDEEIVYVSYYVAYADEAIAYAEYLLDVYYDVYGAYADEAINALYEVETELESIASSLYAMEELLYLGADAVNEALAELNETAMQLEDRVTTAQENTQAWMSSFQEALEGREFEWQNMQPNMEAGDRAQMVEMINGYVEEIRGGISDGHLNRDEIQRITQSGVNAQAAIGKFGGDQLQGLSASIGNLNSMAQRGNTRELSAGVSNFSANMPDFNVSKPGKTRRK